MFLHCLLLNSMFFISMFLNSLFFNSMFIRSEHSTDKWNNLVCVLYHESTSGDDLFKFMSRAGQVRIFFQELMPRRII